jgi:AcrR family transcriptional regulator
LRVASAEHDTSSHHETLYHRVVAVPDDARPDAPANVRGRDAQRDRTRRDILAAARDLVRAGGQPSMSDIAAAARVSRATVYRYFVSGEALLAEVAMGDDRGPLETAAREAGDVRDPAERLAILARNVAEWAFSHEDALRLVLRASLEPQAGVRRPGHRRQWIAEALEPLRGRIDDATHARLSAALTLLFGIDPVVCLTDIAGLEPAEAVEVMEWTARTLVSAAAAGADPPGAGGAERGRPSARGQSPTRPRGASSRSRPSRPQGE